MLYGTVILQDKNCKYSGKSPFSPLRQEGMEVRATNIIIEVCTCLGEGEISLLAIISLKCIWFTS
jgi:hypothetical protein